MPRAYRCLGVLLTACLCLWNDDAGPVLAQAPPPAPLGRPRPPAPRLG